MIEFFKNLSPKAKIIWGVASIAVFAVITGAIIILTRPTHKPEFKLEESSGRVSVSTTEEDEAEEEETKSAEYYSDNHNRAIEKLENPNLTAPDKKELLKGAIERAIDGLKANKEDKPNHQSGYGLTTSDMVQVMHYALEAGYEPNLDTLEVYKSKYDGIYQFVFDMERPSDKTSVTIAGNYSEEQGQVQFSIQVGTVQVAY